MTARRIAILVVIALTAGADLWSAATNSSCQEWSDRETEVRELSLEDLEERYAAPVLSIGRTPGWSYGISLPGVVLLEDGSGFRAWAHEQAHQAQMHQDGHALYAIRYGSDWLRGRYAGCGTYDAYRQVRYEREARELEDTLARQWREREKDTEAPHPSRNI